MRTHGKIATYVHGCRCVVCREASQLYARDIRARRRDREPPAHLHGTVGCYSNWSCRCEECRAAHTTSKRAYRAAAKGSGVGQ